MRTILKDPSFKSAAKQLSTAYLRLLIPPVCLLLSIIALPVMSDELTERCLGYGSLQQERQSDSERSNAIDSCSAAVAAHPNSETLTELLVGLLIRDERTLAAVPHIESLLTGDYSTDTANLVHETCAQLAGAVFTEQSVESLLASDGTIVVGQDTVTLCKLSADLELADPTIGAEARYWGGLAALAATDADRGVSMIGEAAMIGHPMAGEISAYLCDVIDVDDRTTTIREVPVLGRADLLNVAAGSCEAAMSSPPPGRNQGEFVEPLALMLLRYDLSAEAAQLLANAAQSLESPWNERAQRTLLSLCDAVALHPSDPQASGNGVQDHEVVGGQAVNFCAAALQIQPDDPRLTFQYARGLLALGEPDEAAGAFAWSLDQGYSLAANYLSIRTFNAADFAVPEIIGALYNGDNHGMREIEQQYQTVMQAAVGVEANASPFVFRFLSSLVIEFGNLQTYPCGKTYLDGSEQANLQYRAELDQLNQLEIMMDDPFGTIEKVLIESGLAGKIGQAAQTNDLGSVLTSIARTDTEVRHFYEGAANTGAATAKLLAVDYECGTVTKRIIENISDYAANRPMRHSTDG